MDRSFHREEFHIIIFDNVSYNNNKKKTYNIIRIFHTHLPHFFFPFSIYFMFVRICISPEHKKMSLSILSSNVPKHFFFWYKIFVYLFKELMNLFMTLDFECLLCDFNINTCTCLCTGTRVDVMEKRRRRRWHEKTGV